MYPDLISTQYQTLFGGQPTLVVRAPGRINLIGEHTDYNGGFVLPGAIDRALYFAVAPRTDRRIDLFAHNLNRRYEGHLDDLQRVEGPNDWVNYLLGVMSELQRDGHVLCGLQAVVGGDVPQGAGMSSSAAMESGMAFIFNHLCQLNLSPMQRVSIAQRSENNFVGVQCGVMDMFASTMGRANQAVRLDCRSLDYAYYPLNTTDYRLVLCDTGVKHSLVDSEYNTRRAECEAGVRILQETDPTITLLRDAWPDLVAAHEGQMPGRVYDRCAYVVQEIERVKMACTALEHGDYAAFGQLMYATHEGLQHQYEVSCPELDFLVEATRPYPAVYGARMMGGGFGGCTINLVQADAVATVIKDLTVAYRQQFDRALVTHTVQLTNGVELL
jgi:galactokinase